jgi:hypothetical protein
MIDAPSDFRFPRELSERESTWINWLLPDDRPGYSAFKEKIKPLFVLGEGRWGRHDYILGQIGQSIDREAGMQPVVAFGTVIGEPCDVTISLHEPDDEGKIEMQISPVRMEELPNEFQERTRWTYSSWDPGASCPATNGSVREVRLPSTDGTPLFLVISPRQRVVWLHDGIRRTNTLVPVSNFYNELMIVERIRDPKAVFDHALLFREPDRFSDGNLAGAFLAYNTRFRKVPVHRFDQNQDKMQGWLGRLFGR